MSSHDVMETIQQNIAGFPVNGREKQNFRSRTLVESNVRR
jgi:hypothetical protein